MSDKESGGEWSIVPAKRALPAKQRRNRKSLHIQDVILKELLKPREIAIEKEVINPLTGKTETKIIPTTRSNLLLAFDGAMSMVTNSDFRIKAIGIKLLLEFLSKTDNIIYHPAIVAKLDIDNLNISPEEKEKFTALLQIANRQVNELDIEK